MKLPPLLFNKIRKGNNSLIVFFVSRMRPVLTVVFLLIINLFVTLTVFINEGNELVTNLCGQKLGKEVTLTLNSSCTHKITLNSTCVVSIADFITINSSSSAIASVVCILQDPTDPHPTVAFGFTDTKVTMSNIVFEGCGASLKGFHQHFIGQINSSNLHFSADNSAFFIFVNTAVDLTGISIRNNYGFAVIGINLQSSNLVNLTITNNTGIVLSSENKPSIGSGVIILFINSTRRNVTVELVGCNFLENYDYNKDDIGLCIAPRCLESYDSRRIPNAAALTIMSYEDDNYILVNVLQSKFRHNFGTLSAALMILILNSTKTSVKLDQGCVFESNVHLSPCPGSAVYFVMVNKKMDPTSSIRHPNIPLRVLNTNFSKQNEIVGNKLNFRHGAVFVGIKSPGLSLTVEFTNSIFYKNIAEEYASGIFSIVYNFPMLLNTLVSIKLNNIEAQNNKQIKNGEIVSDNGVFVFINNQRVNINGLTATSNHGTVVMSQNSPVYLNGPIKFMCNQAISGALNIRNSFLIFKIGLHLEAQNNYAEELGGVIYVVNSMYTPSPMCALQFLSNNLQNVILRNNTATNGGNIVYAYPIYNCYQTHTGIHVNSAEYYRDLFGDKNYSDINDLLDISSHAYEIRNCGNHSNTIHFPGEKIIVNIAVLDKVKNHAFSLVQVNLVKSSSMKEILRPAKSSIQPMEEIQTVKEIKHANMCSSINVTVNYNDGESEYHKLYLSLKLKGIGFIKTRELHLGPCPPGFTLSHEGSCQCSHAVKILHNSYRFNGTCDINTQTIDKPPLLADPWLGMLENGKFAVSYNCPMDVCSLGLLFSSFKFDNDSNTFLLVNSDKNKVISLCQKKRTGVMCGECLKGYSVVFGSGECMECTNWSLFTLGFYIICGPLLIFVLYSLRLTLTAGTLNGLIFFVQATNVGILQALHAFESYHFGLSKFLIVFLSLLNFNLGFPLCFFEGMDEVWKTGLCLAFPVYLLVIVLVFIVFSHYSSRLSNRISHSSVQVLITVVHLSISNLLITIIDVFTPVKLYTDTGNELVWYRNGMIHFHYNQHHLLILMTLSLLVMCIFLTPYLTLLIGGRRLMRKLSFGNKYFRSTYESIHGPYRESRKYMFTSRFILLISMYIIYAILRGHGIDVVCIATLPLLIVFLVVQMYLRPFKSKLINLIDTAVMLDLVMIYVIGWYNMTFTLSNSKFQKSIIAAFILIFLIFILFVCIIIYHISIITGCHEKIKLVIK